MALEYKVKSGDTLWRIAQRLCGDGNKYPEIIAANNIPNPDLIFVGQQLVIPCTDDETDIEDVDVTTVQPDDTSPIEGIDVSMWQDDINWRKVSDTQVAFAIARATYGMKLRDPKFTDNWHSMESNGLIRGAYHYYRVHQDSDQQVEYFLNTVTLRARDLPPVLDIETAYNENASQQQWVDGVSNWLEKVENATGRTPIIYTSTGAWNQTVNSDQFGQYSLWVANWGVSSPNIPAGWNNWTFWQYTDSGQVDGIMGSVDRDRFNGNRQQLLEFIALS